MMRWARHAENGYEVSTRGDVRFSAMAARLSDGRTIEQHYQIDVKGYRSVRAGKGHPPLNPLSPEGLWWRYLDLWRQWAREHPVEMNDLVRLSAGKTLTDRFASTDINQARALAEIINEALERKHKMEAKATRQQVYAAIDGERDYQDGLWPQDNRPGVPNPLTVGEFLLLIEEYAAKARAEWTKEKKPEMRTLDVIRKIAGITVNCMEQHGAPHRDQREDEPMRSREHLVEGLTKP